MPGDHALYIMILLAVIALLLSGILVVEILRLLNPRKEQNMSDYYPHENHPSQPTNDDPLYIEPDDVYVASVPFPEAVAPEEEHAPAIPVGREKPAASVQVDSSAPALQEITTALRQLSRDFETKLKYDASKQELIDKLYKENKEFKDGIIRKFQHSMITAVIEKIDEAEKDIAVFENREFSEDNYRKLLASFSDISVSFQDMLSAQFDVESFRCEPLTRFDPKAQRSLKTSPTTEADHNKLVKQTLRPGYKTAEGLILRPELVEVYVYDEKRKS